MPSITVNSIVSFIGVIALLVGFFLILTGIGVVKVEKITVVPGKLTSGLGVVLSVIGIFLLRTDLQSSFQDANPTPAATVVVTTAAIESSQPAICGPLRLDAIRPSAILEDQMREYKLIGAGFCTDTTISIATRAFVGNDPKEAPNGLPIEVASDGTWLTVYIQPASSPEQNNVEIVVKNPDGNSASISIAYQR